ncbi:sterol desaturase family protein [Mesorhizobium sp. NBSH29]|uniref:sterol desaturase family protein n=1 Tax=Mesorhizobium sp. NBSH29 TaxID=2654249 RepID=UPI0018966A5B|nr:sterol desaturase family protein [Mesorhizobium sp. NBSH29]QPC86725.1 sterol desaturase family protein [Mesorhizobium sp. NBSH29]
MDSAFSEPVIRIAVFLLIFGSLAVFELWSPRLDREEMRGALKSRRWIANVSLLLVSSAMMRIVFPAAAVGAAAWAQARGYGLLPMLGGHGLVTGILAFVLLDFSIWLEHLASHKLPWLWRLHRVHHADTGFDVTTGLRFHPLEILLSMLWKTAIIVILGAPVLAVLIFEIVLNSTSMFNHSNLKLGLGLDRWLRRVLVTPDMHRVHHSTIRRETDSNYGFNFPFWDRMFGTYRAQPERGHEGIDIGLSAYRGDKPSSLVWAMVLPFRKN